MNSHDAPVFAGIPCRGCFYAQNGCAIVDTLVPGESIMVEREPTNPYDSNAIKVLNLDGVWFGYIGREYAAKIAPWMDRGVFFNAWKTGRVRCQTIITLEPLRSQKAEEKQVAVA